jgi:hypothetical protein
MFCWRQLVALQVISIIQQTSIYWSQKNLLSEKGKSGGVQFYIATNKQPPIPFFIVNLL